MKIYSLKTKMGLAVSGLIIVLIVFMALSSLSYFENVYKKAITQEEFLLAENLAREIDDKLDSAHSVLIATSKEVSNDIVVDPDKAQTFLNSKTGLISMFDNHIFLFSMSGKIIAEAPYEPNRRNLDFSYREYIQTTLKTKMPYVGDPYISSQIHHHPAVMLTAPVYDQHGQIIAIMAGGFDLMKENFLGALPQARMGKTGYYYMYNTNRVMLIHPDPNRVMQQDVPIGSNNLFDKAIEGFEGSGETVNSRGVPSLSSFKHLRKTNWILVANHPLEELYAPLVQARQAFAVAIPVGVSLLIIAVWYVVGNMTMPLVLLTRHVETLNSKKGEDRFSNIISHDEIGALSHAFNMMLRKLDQKTASLEKNNNELARLASTDSLTGAWNRRRLEEAIVIEMEKARRYNLRLSIILFDIDHFKQINDQFGHQTGDRIVVELSGIIRANIRETDSLTRWGGDEFVILLPNSSASQAWEFAERLKALVSAHKFLDVGKVTISMGISEFFMDDDIDTLIKRVDNALYTAKSAGRNIVILGT